MACPLKDAPLRSRLSNQMQDSGLPKNKSVGVRSGARGRRDAFIPLRYARIGAAKVRQESVD